MNRLECSKNIQKRIDKELTDKKLVESIPTDKILNLTINSYVAINKAYQDEHIIAVVECFNRTTIRFKIVAVENPHTYPFNRDIGKTLLEDMFHHQEAIKFNNIINWKVFPNTDLPLLLGWGIQYPFLSDLLATSK